MQDENLSWYFVYKQVEEEMRTARWPIQETLPFLRFQNEVLVESLLVKGQNKVDGKDLDWNCCWP